jgi:hypothetical protein
MPVTIIYTNGFGVTRQNVNYVFRRSFAFSPVLLRQECRSGKKPGPECWAGILQRRDLPVVSRLGAPRPLGYNSKATNLRDWLWQGGRGAGER